MAYHPLCCTMSRPRGAGAQGARAGAARVRARGLFAAWSLDAQRCSHGGEMGALRLLPPGAPARQIAARAGARWRRMLTNPTVPHAPAPAPHRRRSNIGIVWGFFSFFMACAWLTLSVRRYSKR